MQVPSTIDGLRQVLRRLGYGDVLVGVEASDPVAKDLCKQQVDYLFGETSQNAQDEERRRKAISLIERFPWQGGASDGVHGLKDDTAVHASTEGFYIIHEKNRKVTYYGPFQTEDEARIVAAVTHRDAKLGDLNELKNTVQLRGFLVAQYGEDELNYMEDDPTAFGFKKVMVRPGNRVPIDSWFVRNRYLNRVTWAGVEKVLQESGKTWKGFMTWLNDFAKRDMLKGSAEDALLEEVQRLRALLEEEQDLVPLEVEEVLEDENGQAEAIVVPEWDEDDAPEASLEAAALALLERL